MRVPFSRPLTLALAAGALLSVAAVPAIFRLGKQADGAFFVSSGQRIEPGAIAFDGRPIDLALHPSGEFAAVLGQNRVFLVSRSGVLDGDAVPLGAGAAYHGLIWSPDGKKCYASAAGGFVLEMNLTDARTLTAGRRLLVDDNGKSYRGRTNVDNPRPGGMAITRDGASLFVACCDLNAVVRIDLSSGKVRGEYRTELLPFDVKLTADERTLVVSNWGGKSPTTKDRKAASGNAEITVDALGGPASGTVSLISLNGEGNTVIPVGKHPTGVLIDGNRAYVACAASDSVSVVDTAARKVVRTIPVRQPNLRLFGAMPNALALSPDKKTLFVCNGGDNAVAEADLSAKDDRAIRGYRPVGYFPSGIALTADGRTAWVINTKGNGSVRNTVKGEKGNAHDFQGTVSVLDLNADLAVETAKVVRNNGWNRTADQLKPKRAVYNGAIKHVLYIIKENRTYDEVFGDLPQGNGDPNLAILAPFAPNHRKIAQEFTLFDNGYVSGTNSADGHAWSNQAIANDYLEHFYTGYRTYPDDGDFAMSIPASGNLWDAAEKKGKSIRVYGEFCDDRMATFLDTSRKTAAHPDGEPFEPGSWMDIWKDRGRGRFRYRVGTRVDSLRKYIHPEVVYWPLWQSDQVRADLFIEEYTRFSRENRVPNLMILSLPCDHTEGRNPQYPTVRAMMADNDLALGRVVEAVSKSPQWKNTCIFVIEDDAQSGPDHVDGHRTVYMAISPYVRRKFTDSTLLTTVSMLRSIELMLGLDPMNRFDAVTPPLSDCFTDTPDLTPYTVTPNTVPLDEMNPPVQAQTGKELYWTRQSLALDWSGIDRPDPEILSRVIWHSIRGVDTPYPVRPTGNAPFANDETVGQAGREANTGRRTDRAGR
ncbi:MAG: alkaline phosphatase family protein [Capsulimonadales bacterium]|nr:alkaline phosphatase family protein [Capsulimonadales bacterium]